MDHLQPARRENSAPPQAAEKGLRVCIAADHGSYRFGGEAVLPLHYFTHLRQRQIEAWLVVHSRTRDELEALFPGEKDRIRYIPDTWIHRTLMRVSAGMPRRIAGATVGLLSLLSTQYVQRKIIRSLIREHRIDVVHQPTPVSPRFPSLLTGLGVPVVIGPMNGGMDYPPAFKNRESPISRLGVAAGRRLTNLANICLPGKRRAAVLLVANERTRRALPSCIRGEVVELVENGVDLGTWAVDREPVSLETGACRFVFVGRLVDWKCVDMAIEALARTPGTVLEILGDGPMRGPLEQLSVALGVSSRVSFAGWLPQRECALRLQSAAALLLPSIYESGGAVVLEAMAAGVPVIATRWGGPVDYLDESCGLLINPLSRGAIVEGFATGMRRLQNDPGLRARLGARGRERVHQHFDWQKKTDRILEIYRMALAAAAKSRAGR